MKKLLFIALFFCSLTAIGQVTVFGTIVDEEGKEMTGVTVLTSYMGVETISDETGSFTLVVPKGKQTIRFVMNGYKQTLKGMFFDPDKNYELSVVLVEDKSKNRNEESSVLVTTRDKDKQAGN